MNLSMFSCSHFCSIRKQCVQESSGNYAKRCDGSGEAETNEFGVKEPPERQENFFARAE